MRSIFTIVCAGLAVSGCAITKMEARIAPAPQVAASTIGGGREVGVVVTDERPRKDLGRRAAGGGNIRESQQLEPIYQQAIIDGLNAKGFHAIGGRSTASNLKVELRSLNYDPSTGLFTVGADIDASMKAYATGGGAEYDNMYRANASHRTFAVSGAKAANAKLNAVVNDEIEAMFNDQKLLETLAGR